MKNWSKQATRKPQQYIVLPISYHASVGVKQSQLETVQIFSFKKFVNNYCDCL